MDIIKIPFSSINFSIYIPYYEVRSHPSSLPISETFFEDGGDQVVDGDIVVGEDHRVTISQKFLQFALRHDMGGNHYALSSHFSNEIVHVQLLRARHHCKGTDTDMPSKKSARAPILMFVLTSSSKWSYK